MLPSAEHVVKEGKFHTSRSVCLSATTQTWFLGGVGHTGNCAFQHPGGLSIMAWDNSAQNSLLELPVL